MPRVARIVLVLVVLAGAGVAGWWLTTRHKATDALTLYGNVDLRQVNLPFNDTQRVAQVLVQEGDFVRRGQLLARLDTSRLLPQVDQAQALVQRQQAVVAELHHGTRPQQVAEARANVAAAAAEAENARAQYRRVMALAHSSAGRAVSRQDVDAAKAALDVAAAKLDVARKALELAVIGPRTEHIEQAEAQLRADQAQLALLRQQLRDADLRAPLDAIVSSRVVEPGDMSSPQKVAFTLSIVNPKWVRAYVTEPELGVVRPGMCATIITDAFGGRRFEGWVGFISPVAEFTPKSVETPQLRTSLVYEIRVFVKDPEDLLRLGMPATVQLPLHGRGGVGPAQSCGPVPPPAPGGAVPEHPGAARAGPPGQAGTGSAGAARTAAASGTPARGTR